MYQDESNDGGPQFPDLRHYLGVLKRQWWLVALGLVGGILVALIMTQLATPEYRSTARVYVSFAGERSANGSELRAATTVQERLGDYAELGSTPVVLKPAADDVSAATGEEVTVGELRSAISIKPRSSNTSFLDVSATTGNPEQSAQWANSTALVVARSIEAVETPPGAESSLVRASVVQPALPSNSPVSPNARMNLLLGSLLGLSLGIAAALLREQLDRTVKSSATLAEYSGSPVLGAVPYDNEAKTSPIIPSGKSAARSEAFRKLRTNLQYVNVDNPPRVIAVVSASPSEGKSTTAANLALTLALAGSRVVLVETDLRRPRLATYFGISGEVGLTDVLAGKVDWQDVVVPWNRGLISIIGQGEQAPNPTELLGSMNMATLLAELREAYDYVILDTAPISLVSDATVVASQSDGVIMAVRYGKTNRDEVASARNALDQVNARVLGSVMTFRPTGRKSTYGSGYGYGYGYGYGDSKQGYGDASYATRGMVYETVESPTTSSPDGVDATSASDDKAVTSAPRDA